jgi:hypothetical protein
MKSTTLLLRQVHPNWVKDDGTVASIALWPFPKDQGLLSVDDGDGVTAAASWQRYVAQPDRLSAGVWAFTVEEAVALSLPATADPRDGNPQHVLVDFTAFAEKQQKAKAKLLSVPVNARGCLHSAGE